MVSMRRFSETHRLRLGYRNIVVMFIFRAIGIGAARRAFGRRWLVRLFLVVILHNGSLRLYRRSGCFCLWRRRQRRLQVESRFNFWRCLRNERQWIESQFVTLYLAR